MQSSKIGNGFDVEECTDVEMVAIKSHDIDTSHGDTRDAGFHDDDATIRTPDVGAKRAVAGFKDTGYSWVILGVVLADFCLVAIGLGAIGVLYPHFVEHFRCTMYEAGWIGSLHMAMGALIGLFMSPVIGRFGCRKVAMLGSVMGGLGYTSSYLSQTVSQMYLTFGLCGGIGNGMLLISSSVILQQYFDKRRTIATALATTGFGISPLVFAPLTRWMAETLGWRTAMFILGCVYLQGAVFGSLLRPAPVTGGLANGAQKTTPGDGHGLNGNSNADGDHDVRSRSRCSTVGAFLTSLCRALNLSLLIDIRFVVMTFSSAVAIFGYFAPFMFLPSHAQSGPQRLDATSAANLIAVMALSMSVGRVASGIVGDRMSSMVCFPTSCRQSKERRLFHYAIPMTLAGLANAGVVLWQGRAALIIYSSVVGMLTGSYIVMQQPVLIDLLGMQCFAGAYGLFMMFNGIASLASQPFSGWLKDVSGTFSLPFLVCGLMQAMGGILLIGLGVVRSCRGSADRSTKYQSAAQSEKENGH